MEQGKAWLNCVQYSVYVFFGDIDEQAGHSVQETTNADKMSLEPDKMTAYFRLRMQVVPQFPKIRRTGFSSSDQLRIIQ